jgi:hypothetical protein
VRRPRAAPAGAIAEEIRNRTLAEQPPLLRLAQLLIRGLDQRTDLVPLPHTQAPINDVGLVAGPMARGTRGCLAVADHAPRLSSRAVAARCSSAPPWLELGGGDV